ncbi:MAG: AAA family ATPase [Alphaproteobacteria bacterium]|nr:AAA family ATPase [Alphaproteobacteria bacterium]
MPYLAHFGLEERPFTLTPNPDMYMHTPEHTAIAQAVVYALKQQAGVIKVVGDIGTGKTLLCRILLHALNDVQPLAYINAPERDEDRLVDTVCKEFGVYPGSRESAFEALRYFLLEKHAQGFTPILLVDEAQALGVEGLESLRLLSNLETEHAKLLQIVLFGQPELDLLLRRYELRQLNQRVVHGFYTSKLTMDEAEHYVRHRIACCKRKSNRRELFTKGALTLIAKSSRGIPRLLNVLSEKALLVAYTDTAPRVERSHVEDAVADSKDILFAPVAIMDKTTTRRVLWAALAAEAALAAVIAVLLLPVGDVGGSIFSRVVEQLAPSVTSVQTQTASLPGPETDQSRDR